MILVIYLVSVLFAFPLLMCIIALNDVMIKKFREKPLGYWIVIVLATLLGPLTSAVLLAILIGYSWKMTIDLLGGKL